MKIIINCDKYREYSDDEFIDAILSGIEEPEACFREIFIDEPVHSIVSKKFYCLKDDVDDICQEIWKKFKENNWRVLINFRNLPNQPAPPILRYYIWGAVNNFILKHHKNKFYNVLLPLISDDGEDIEIAAPESDRPDKKSELKDVLNKIEKTVELFFKEVIPNDGISKAGLNENEQRIVRLKCVTQIPLSSKEIGDILKMMPGAVDTAFSRARVKMRIYFENIGIFEDILEILRDTHDI